MRTIAMTIATAALIAGTATAAYAEQKSDAAGAAKHDGVMTEKMGETVPKMTSDEKPAKESKADDAATYTGKVGEAVPTMTAPEGDKKAETKKQ